MNTTNADEHVARDPWQVRHPGGKDGMWRSGCSCGYITGFHGHKGHAEVAVIQHIRDKTAARA